MWDTAATSAATTAAMAAYPTNVTINENVAAPPAPAVTNSQAEAVTCLKELKSLQQQGLITAAQY